MRKTTRVQAVPRDFGHPWQVTSSHDDFLCCVLRRTMICVFIEDPPSARVGSTVFPLLSFVFATTSGMYSLMLHGLLKWPLLTFLHLCSLSVSSAQAQDVERPFLYSFCSFIIHFLSSSLPLTGRNIFQFDLLNSSPFVSRFSPSTGASSSQHTTFSNFPRWFLEHSWPPGPYSTS